jgi:hypothetical protein
LQFATGGNLGFGLGICEVDIGFSFAIHPPFHWADAHSIISKRKGGLSEHYDTAIYGL